MFLNGPFCLLEYTTKCPRRSDISTVENPETAIARYLLYVVNEAEKRGYTFDRGKIFENGECGNIPVNKGQLEYERRHLLSKLRTRDTGRYSELKNLRKIETHPLFTKVDGGIEEWEVIR